MVKRSGSGAGYLSFFNAVEGNGSGGEYLFFFDAAKGSVIQVVGIFLLVKFWWRKMTKPL